MKKSSNLNYTFTAATKILDFSGEVGFNIKFLYAVINVTAKTVIYATGTSGLGYASISGGNILTLQYDTTAMNNADILQFIYEEKGQKTSALSDSVVLSSDHSDINITGNKTSLPLQTDKYLNIRSAPANKFRTTFAATIASGVDTNFFTLISTGSGQTVSQSGGNLLLTTGTTTNSETVLRSTATFSDALISRYQVTMSQRIVNQNLFVELVDVIGDSLAVTVNSATSITVTIPSNPFTAQNVGQSIYVGVISGISGAIPGRYAIASVSGNNVNFTVAGWPVSGSGTLSLWGWNYSQIVYNGTTSINANYDCQRRGWNSGFTTATINTTAAPGHMGIMTIEDGIASYQDQLVASATGVQATMRASRVVNIPEQTATLYLQIRSLNGSVAPASTSTYTIGMCHVENYTSMPVTVNQTKAQAYAATIPTAVLNTPAVTISSGTVTTVSTVTTCNTVTTVGTASLAAGALTADIASAAITTSATTAAVTQGNAQSCSFSVAVTAVSGTTPTLDIGIEESSDSGTNWVRIYDFPRITATGFYHTPCISLFGNRIRYVQTVAGTTPSFTRSLNRLNYSVEGINMRQIFDRTIVPNTLNSTSAILNTENCSDIQVTINTVAATTPATFQLQGSEDSSNWYSIGSTFNGTVGTVSPTPSLNVFPKFVRVIVTVAGTGVTLGYVQIKARGR